VGYLSLKDFILYNSPCRICGGKSSLSLFSGDANFVMNKVRAIGYDNHVLLRLASNYTSSLSIDININNNTYHLLSGDANKLITFKAYLKDRFFYFELKCNSCGTFVITEDLSFDDRFLNPIKICDEYLFIRDDDSFYAVHTDIAKKTTNLKVMARGFGGDTIDEMKLPYNTIERFKTREKILYIIGAIRNF
jgi:hypothetical protein